MNELRIKQVIEYLEEKQKSQFTGSIRISFEFGNVVAINEANRHDLLTDEAKSNDIVAECFKMASDPLFSGHLSFVFKNGNVTNYSYAKMLKGDTLKRFFSNKG